MKKVSFILLCLVLFTSCGKNKLSGEELKELPGAAMLSGASDLTPKTDDVDISDISVNMSYLSNKGKNVVIFDLMPGQKVASPLKMSGMIPTNWVFEGSFPVKIYSMDGKELGTGIGKADIYDAQGNVITPNVGFEAEVEFEVTGDIPAGRVELRADNPSGLPENEDSVNLPIVF